MYQKKQNSCKHKIYVHLQPILYLFRTCSLFLFFSFFLASCSEKDNPTIKDDEPSENTNGSNGGTNGSNGGTNDGESNSGGIPASSRNADIVQIETGIHGHTLVLLSDNTLWGVGNNYSKQLGLQDSQYSTLTLIAENVKFAKTLSRVTVIIKTDNTLWGVGQNNEGMLGNRGDVSSFIKLEDNVKSVYGNSNHLLILKNDNTLWGSGRNEYHTISDEGSGEFSDIIRTPVKIADNVKEAAAGSGYTLVLKNDNTLWGRGTGNALGLGRDSKTLVHITDNVKKVDVGSYDSGIIKTDNSLWVAGTTPALGGTAYYNVVWLTSNLYSLQNRSTGGTGIPVFSKVLDNVKDIKFGNAHSLALLNDDTIWGAGFSSGLGDPGGESRHSSFVKVTDNGQLISAGSNNSLILKQDKTLLATGVNDYGQLGDRTTQDKPSTFVSVHLPWKSN